MLDWDRNAYRHWLLLRHLPPGCRWMSDVGDHPVLPLLPGPADRP